MVRQSRSESAGYCPECAGALCPCGAPAGNPVVPLADGRWHCRACHRRAWPDRVAFWETVGEARRALAIRPAGER